MKKRIKLNHLSLFLIVIILFSTLVTMYLQYRVSKDMIIENYKNEYYNKTLHIRENIRLLFDKLQFDFRKVEKQNIQKLNQLFEIYKKEKNNFDIEKAVEELNKDISFGEYQVFLINKDYIIEEASYKADKGFRLGQFKSISELLQKIFNKTVQMDISAVKLESSSMNLKRYLIKLSDDEKYILQIGFELDIYDILKDRYEHYKNELKDLNIYLSDSYSFQKIHFDDENFAKKTLAENWNNAKKFLFEINKSLNKEEINSLLKSDISETNINFSKTLNKILSKDEKIIFFIDNKNELIKYYSVTDSIFNKKDDETKLIIETSFSTKKLSNSIMKSFGIFILSLSIVLVILFFVHLIINRSLVLEISSFVRKIKNNKNTEENSSYIEEIYIMNKSYNKLHTELNEQIKINKELSYTDTLTKLKNRKAYDEKLDELLTCKKRYGIDFSFLIFDIDNFKKINDNFGHDIGDKVLIEISQLIENLIRKNDFLYRIGGEEFVVLLSSTTKEKANITALKIRQAVENTTIIENLKVTISIGLTQANKFDTNETIFKRVDELLYISKHTGKNKVTID